MSIEFGIFMVLFLVPLILLVIAIFYLYGGENGYNKYCEKSNTCSDTVRCRAKSINECACFEPKKRRKNRFLE